MSPPWSAAGLLLSRVTVVHHGRPHSGETAGGKGGCRDIHGQRPRAFMSAGAPDGQNVAWWLVAAQRWM